jgi:hypothetical protein
MSTLVLVLILMVNTIALHGPGPGPGPNAVPDEMILLYPEPFADIAVLENDGDAGEDEDLRVIALPLVAGAKAEIIGGKIVRVYLDWSSIDISNIVNPVAHGTYVVSDGRGQSSTTWEVWYWPEMQP